MYLPVIEKQNKNRYSNAAVYQIASVVTRATGALLPLMPKNMKASLYGWAYEKENTIANQRLENGTYPDRTWYGLNGVDQYDLLADFVMLNGYKSGVR